jgi:hypothetical protein
MAAWGCFAYDWISKEWLDYCERKGCTLLDVFSIIESELEEEGEKSNV